MWILTLPFIFGLWATEQPVEKAQALALKKNRSEACALLRKSLEEIPAGGKGRGKIVESLHQISKMFFTDKGQKHFEAGQASMWENPDIALNQFRAALELEDQNIQVLGSLARVQLIKQDCDGAMQSLQGARKLNPLSAEPALLELRVYACKQNFEMMRGKAKDLPALDKWQEAYVQYLLALDSLQQRSWRKVFEAMAKVSEEQPQFPESYLLMAKAGIELNKDVEPAMQKYVSLCRALTVREKKRFSLEPRLCANLKEAEDELAQRKSQDI